MRWNMIPDKTYILRFTLRDGSSEEQEHTLPGDAWEAFRLFVEPGSADIYSVVELVCHDWEANSEELVARMDFNK